MGTGRAQRRHLEPEGTVVDELRAGLVELASREQRADDADDVAHLRERLLELAAVEALDDARAARADAEDEATLADLVERGRRHRERARGAAAHVDDAGAELDALGVDRHLGEQRDGVVAPRLGEPEGVVAELVGELRGLR